MVLKEKRMNEAKILKREHFTQKQIADALGVTDRSIRNYLKLPDNYRGSVKRKSKLDHFKSVIDSMLNDRQDYSAILIFEKIKSIGYTGQISILRDYVAEVQKKLSTEAVIRFETIPGKQAQVDWKEYGRLYVDGRIQKLYAFVMTLGYSRKPFVCYTLSMKQSVLHECHRMAFEHFGGVPEEILYDNMKTAWVYDTEKGFVPNQKLLVFANHYGFILRRCRIKRPKTKGKVERMIRYLKTNFWPRVCKDELSLDYLNEKVIEWLKYVDEKEMREFRENRNTRFERERGYLGMLPASPYDCREILEVKVNNESFIHIDSNRYSVPPEYIQTSLTAKIDRFKNEAEIFAGNKSIRKIKIEREGEGKKIWFFEDKKDLYELWKKQQTRENTKMLLKKPLQEAVQDVEIRKPSFYDSLTGVA